MGRLRTVWYLLNLPCEGMARLASKSLDRELTRMERLALRVHVLYCAGCRRYRRQLELLQSAIRRLETGEPLPGPDLPDAVRERIKQALERH